MDLGGTDTEGRLSSDRQRIAKNKLGLERLWGEGT